MILTGQEIYNQKKLGNIVIDPFICSSVNPNSYNFRLGRILKTYKSAVIDSRVKKDVETIYIEDEGYILQPNRLYLAETVEVIGSNKFVPTFCTRSSVARMGLAINLAANLGDIGYIGKWTLQLHCLHPIKIYHNMKIGQVMFWEALGDVRLYSGKYQSSSTAQESLLHHDFVTK